MITSAFLRSSVAVRAVVAPRSTQRYGLRAVASVSAAPSASSVWMRQCCPATLVPGVRSFASRKKSSGRPGDAGGDREKALAMALKQVESQFGKGSIMKLGESTRPKVDVISTGSLTLDYALGVGGLPRGRVVEIYGPEASGKTTLALHVIAEAQKTDATCVFIDAEHALDPQYASGLGVNLSELHLAQPSNGEEALEICDVLVRSGGVDVLVVDSVAALVPRAELEGEMGDHHIALQARLMSQALRKLTSSLSRSNTLIIFINQIRSKVGVMFGSPEVTAGGNALKYYSSVRIDIRKSTPLKQGDRVTGNLTKVKVVKNKVAPPFRTAEFDMVYGKGIQRSGELVDLGTQFGILTRAGAWYSFTDSGDLVGQGREKAKAFFEDNAEEADKLAAAVTEHLRAAHAPLPAPEPPSDVESDPEAYEPEDVDVTDLEQAPEPEPESDVEAATTSTSS